MAPYQEPRSIRGKLPLTDQPLAALGQEGPGPMLM